LAASLTALAVPVIASAQQPNDQVEHAILAPLASKSLLLGIATAGDRLVVVGERGHILLSDDNGASWRQVEVPTRATLTGVYFHDASFGWAVGHDAIILRTTDGGETWQTVHLAPEEEAPLLSVWFSDADNGFAIGAYGFFLVTTDGGSTWEWVTISDYDFHLHDVSRADSGRLYMAAEAGAAYASDDGGGTWAELPSPYDGSFFAALALEGDSVLLAGLRGHLYRSDDAGQTWTELETDTAAMLTSALDLGDGRIVVFGLGGALLVSDDGGQSFSVRPRTSRRGVSDAILAPDGSVVAVGEGGTQRFTLADLALN
jgi:photosystem II stability/assembly factor-like uncharacterized protein